MERATGSGVSPAPLHPQHTDDGTTHPLSRRPLLLRGVATLLLVCVAFVLHRIPLPHDEHFRAVVYLMWSGNQVDQVAVVWLLLLFLTVTILHAALQLAGAVFVPRERTPYERFVLLARRDGVLLSLWLMLVLNLSRYISNVLYEVAEGISWDLTPFIGRLEGPFIASLQAASNHEVISRTAAWFYSVGWYVPMLLAGPLAQVCGPRGLMERFLLATFLTAVLAIPAFLLMPVFEPWAVNPLYGYQGLEPQAVAYAYPGAEPAALQHIATRLRWATGACLPSLHVAFPLVYAALFARRAPVLGSAYLLLAIITAIGVVLLGRHWVVDAVLAAPYAFVVVWLTHRIGSRTVCLTGDR